MIEKIEPYEQWKLEGDCNICKRQKYCTKGCRVRKINQQKELNNLVTTAFLKYLLNGGRKHD